MRCQPERFPQVVRHVDERDVARSLKLDQQVTERLASRGVERGERFVEQQSRRIRGKRPGKGHALSLSSRKLAGRAMGELASTHTFQPFVRTRGSRRAL